MGGGEARGMGGGLRLTRLAIPPPRAYYGRNARPRLGKQRRWAMKGAITVAITAIAFFGTVALVSGGDVGGWFDKYVILWN